jgi:N-acyl-D-amino-acid deacylase
MKYRYLNQKQEQKLRWLFLFSGVILLTLISAYFYIQCRAVSYDIAIINADIHDGTKDGKGYRGGVGIKGDKIVKIWKGRSWFIKPRAAQLIDAKGADLSPGFIDTHSHADLSISNSGNGKVSADNFVGQGITTVIVGNCGRSHSNIPVFARSFKNRKSNINIATLIGLNAIRKKVMNESIAPANLSEIARMCEMIKSGMKVGALGVSTGLAYPPGIFASKVEIVAQLKVAKEFGGIHATHMRNEGGEIKKAVEEVIDYSQSAGIPLLISHYKITGLKNCGQFDMLKKIINHVRSKGMQIHLDYYPYDASSTNLNIFLPKWYLALNQKGKSKAIATPTGRKKIKVGIIEVLNHEGFSDFKFATVSYYAPHREWQGHSLDIIDRFRRKATVSTLDGQLDIFVEMESHGGAQMIYHNIYPDVIDRIPKEEENMIGTDSAIRYNNSESIPHPRGWGTFPRFIRYFVREKKLLSIDEAVYRMAGLPAKVFHIDNRGKIQNNYYADLVLFDVKTISDMATYQDPLLPPVGIKYVIINGTVVMDNTGNRKVNKGNANILDVYPGQFVQRGKREVCQ